MNRAAASPSTTRRRALRLALAVVVPPFGLVIGAALLDGYSQTRAIGVSRGSGWLALCTLLVALCVTPLARTLPERRETVQLLAALLRALGITAAWLALTHAALSTFGFLRGQLGVIPVTPHLRTGLVALCILLVLLTTSFPQVVSLLRLSLWKELHRLAYLAAGLATLHVMLSPFAPRILVIFALAWLGLMAGARAWPDRQRAPGNPPAGPETISE